LKPFVAAGFVFAGSVFFGDSGADAFGIRDPPRLIFAAV
jgi:hypothetical protein